MTKTVLSFILGGLFVLLAAVLILEIAQPGNWDGLRGLFSADPMEDEVYVPVEDEASPPFVQVTPPPPPVLPEETPIPREEPDLTIPLNPPVQTPAPSIPRTQEPTVIDPNINVGSVFRFGDFMWRVLDVQGSVALIMTNEVILTLPYNHGIGPVTWETSSVRNELNTVFYESFHPNDRARILETTVTTNNNPWFYTLGGNPVNDRIFLLSIEEVVHMFGDSGLLGERVPPQDWQNPETWYIADGYDTHRQVPGNMMWWLRSPGFDSNRAAAVTPRGQISMRGDFLTMEPAGIRPAMWIHLGFEPVVPAPPSPFPTPVFPVPPIGTLPTPLPPVLPVPPIGTVPTPAPPVLPQPPGAVDLRVGDITTFGGFEFIVLDTFGREALILSRNTLFNMPFHDTEEPVNWSTSSLRNYLNTEFLQSGSFTQAEINRILFSNRAKNEVESNDNPWFGTYGGPDVYDLVFLLCIELVTWYFGDSGYVGFGIDPANRTALWPGHGAHLWGIHDAYSTHRQAFDLQNRPSRWWLKNPGFFSTDAVYVQGDGALSINGSTISLTDVGVRPAMWIRF